MPLLCRHGSFSDNNPQPEIVRDIFDRPPKFVFHPFVYQNPADTLILLINIAYTPYVRLTEVLFFRFMFIMFQTYIISALILTTEYFVVYGLVRCNINIKDLFVY